LLLAFEREHEDQARVYEEDQDAPKTEIRKLMGANLEMWEDDREMRSEHEENGARA
jgi:hypothetical protein